MDRSFLSHAAVIAASRKFVCIRLMTYEDQQEADFLKTLFVGKSGDLENTTFGLLSPDGRRQLVRAGRSARHSFTSPAEMAETMNRIAGEIEPRVADGGRGLPTVKNVRLALDVAACDQQPLVVLHAQNDGVLRQLAQVRKLAWSDDFIGRAVYTVAIDGDHLKPIEGVLPQSALIVVQSDRFGLKGKALAQCAAEAPAAELARTLREGIGRHQTTEKGNHLDHVREGHRAGVYWETRIPVTDPLEKRAREKGRKPPP